MRYTDSFAEAKNISPPSNFLLLSLRGAILLVGSVILREYDQDSTHLDIGTGYPCTGHRRANAVFAGYMMAAFGVAVTLGVVLAMGSKGLCRRKSFVR